MSNHKKATAKMGPPSVKAEGANATADYTSVSSADSPAASTDITSISSLDSTMIKSALPKSTSPPTTPSKVFDSEEERGAWFEKVLEDIKNNTPEENAAIARKYGPRTWEELQTKVLRPEREAAAKNRKQRVRGSSLHDVRAAILRGESTGQMKYSSQHHDTSKWTRLDWHAWFLLTVRAANMRSVEGLFFQHNLPVQTVDVLLWYVLQRENYCLAPSRQKGTGSNVSKAPEAEPSRKRKAENLQVEPDWLIKTHLPKPLVCKSETMDMSDPWWQARFVEKALAEANIACETFDSCLCDDTSHHNDNLDAFMWSKELEAVDLEDGHDRVSFLIEPNQEELRTFTEQQKWLDNTLFQREDYIESCNALGISSSKPRVVGMRRSVLLKVWQPLAIQALLEFETKAYLRGAILADGVGLGKTWEAIGFFLAQIRRDETLGKDAPKPRPILIIVPPNLIAQWIEELYKVCANINIYYYYGDKRSSVADKAQRISKILDKKHPIFDGTKQRRRCIVVTSYQSFSSRHGPTSLGRWRRKELGLKLVEIQKLSKTSDKRWPENLCDLFGTVVLDEAHLVKNRETQTASVVLWLEPKFYLLLTATPISNRIEDFLGYAPLIFNDSGAWSLEGLEKLGAQKATNPFELANDHPAIVLRYTELAIKKYIYGEDVYPTVAGYRLGKNFEGCLIKRSFASCIPEKVRKDK
ncbi:hypothetical protein McanMca71_002413 [Microsporum canis]